MLVSELRKALADMPDNEIVYCTVTDGSTNVPIERVELLSEELSNGEMNYFGVLLYARP